ncbi:uncharacterized protein C12orf56 homolog isoform X2 [Salmo salar]|uniref:Uncharacterized protein C12orf56 homolog isoform X2 n=1 Tax=Salmo salar TaxID=8030 RepID=A0A1S3MYV7_SALSA|nr:uncharacterized protein C12orf56 homolog isoform X2 [Salmo salar]
MPMAMTGAGGLQCRRNSKLDSFLKRNTERGVYERIRAYEPCVVVSERVNKVFMHVVLSDECVYLAEYPPRTLTTAVDFRHIRDIELVNDLPEFLSGRDRERSQHIRVVYATAKPSGKKNGLLRGEPRVPPVPSPRQHWPISPSMEGIGGTLLSTRSEPPDRDGWNVSPVPMRNREEEEEEVLRLKTTRSASCPNPETLGDRTQIPREAPLVPRRRGSVLARLLKRDRVVRERDGEKEEEEGGEREAELHLYAVSPTSRIYLHLQSSWNSYIIRSTLLLDPLYRRRCNVMLSTSPQKQAPISWERTAHLFRQLSGELLQEGISLESLYLLLQELRTAAHRSITLRKLFWRSNDMFPFLVPMLEDSLRSCQRSETNTADSLLLCTLIAQTLALMFRETEIEPARLNMLTAKQGALTARLLLALVCDPELQSQTQGSRRVSPDSRQGSPPHTELQGLLEEYLDAGCSLLFELVVLCQEASRTPSLEHFLTVGWILRILQPHPSLLSFVGYQARQVVVVLSGSQTPLSPSQAALLFQRCRVLLACLKYSSHLGQHLRTEYREEFRYYVKLPCVEEKLPPDYPISQPALRLVSQLLGLIIQKS